MPPIAQTILLAKHQRAQILSEISVILVKVKNITIRKGCYMVYTLIITRSIFLMIMCAHFNHIN